MFSKDGYTCYYSDTTGLLKEMDEAFLSFLSGYKVNSWLIPAMIDGDILARCGYFTTMPNQLTKVSILDPSNLLDSVNFDNKNSTQFDSSNNKYLTPAACLHFYPMLSRVNVYNEIITTSARVYRYEDGAYTAGQRQWDFTVREFVAVGSKVFVTEFLEKMKMQLTEYARQFCPEVVVNQANDHFYPTQINKFKERFQMVNRLKYELVASVDNTEVAISSFNNHGTHFSEEFGFDKEGSVVTGCVGCGMDRWLTIRKQ